LPYSAIFKLETRETMQRRSFVKTAILGSMVFTTGSFIPKKKTHLLTLSFDDGFKKSFYKIAELHEQYGLKACLNVIASGHLATFAPPDKYHSNLVRGDFNDWNLLKGRGHEIMPHSWDHSNLTQMPVEKAKEDILRCLGYFEKNLTGFKSSGAVYNFSFNASTRELEDFALEHTMAVRSGGWDIIENQRPENPFPRSGVPARLGCWSFGPDNADKWVEDEVTKFLTGQGGWLILNLHGLDEEGWGPVSSAYLDELLKRLVKVDKLEILPAGVALRQS
jgi:peptidoglycan/xylan/chitin deacetylase (PgdA/CDA1 family)